MQHIGVFYNPFSEASRHYASELAEWLTLQGRTVWCGTSDEGRDAREVWERMDLLITLGGDGTTLRAARLAIPHGIPVLSVALGRLNFMSELSPETMKQGIEMLLAGEGWYEQRALIEASLLRNGQSIYHGTALNEVVLSRGDINRILTVEVQIDDIPLTTYRADGVLVSTATGSTAYALSAGGPIVDPRSRSMVLVPIAAHLTAVPSMILHEDTEVLLIKRSHHRAGLSIDGSETLAIQQHDRIQISRCQQVCFLARVQPPKQLFASFVQRLRRE